MYRALNNDGPYYIYTEYCPGPFFWGWWLYAAPIVQTEEPLWSVPLPAQESPDWPDRKRYVWLTEGWRIDALYQALGLPDQRECGPGNYYKTYTYAFLDKYPNGVLVKIGRDGRDIELLDCPRLWDYARIVRELQLLDWREARPTNQKEIGNSEESSSQ